MPSGSLASKLKRAIRWRPEAQRLMTHPGVGALTALSFALIIGKPSASGVECKWRAIPDWYRWKSPAAIGDG